MRHLYAPILTTAAIALPQAAQAQVAAADSGDTGWLLFCTILVLMAAIPGLALRHAGLVNIRNALSIMAQGAGIAATVSIAWAIIGYSLAYAPGSMWLGGAGNMLLANLSTLRDGMTVPESAFALFQMSLAILAAAIVAGAVAERARFGWIVIFAPLWMLIVYAPVARWTWGGGWLADRGVLDYSGALVIHLTAGFSALALALIAGQRGQISVDGHSPVLTIAGSGLVWIGWFGVSGGWALGASDDAASALMNCQLAASAAALGWGLFDRVLTGRSSATGILTGALSGLVAISASAGLVGAGGAMLIGLIAAFCCRAAFGLMQSSRVDDAAGVFAIHGVGGLIGLLLLVPFTLPITGGVGFDVSFGPGALLSAQATGIAIVALWSVIGSAIVALAISVVMPLRASAADETDGLDAGDHGQQGWDLR